MQFIRNGVRCYGDLYFSQVNPRLDEGQGLAVIIPCAGQGRKMKSHGHKSLVELRPGETVLSRQLKLLGDRFPQADIFVVTGYESDRVYIQIPDGVRVIENEFFEVTNVARSLDLALRACLAEGVLIVYGDLVFNKSTLAECPEDSWVLIDDKGQINPLEVGVTVVDGQATRFAFELPTKWAQIAYLTGNELKLFRELASERERHRCFTHELLNEVLDQGGSLLAHNPSDMKLAEIDCSKDIEQAQRIR